MFVPPALEIVLTFPRRLESLSSDDGEEDNLPETEEWVLVPPSREIMLNFPRRPKCRNAFIDANNPLSVTESHVQSCKKTNQLHYLNWQG